MLHSYVFLKKAFCTRYFTFYLSCLLFILYKTKRLKLKHMWPWLSIACRARENEKYTSMQFCICCWWRSQRNKKKILQSPNVIEFFFFIVYSLDFQCVCNVVAIVPEYISSFNERCVIYLLRAIIWFVNLPTCCHSKTTTPLSNISSEKNTKKFSSKIRFFFCIQNDVILFRITSDLKNHFKFTLFSTKTHT